MKRLLRSCIDFDGEITRENLVLNFQKLTLGAVEWDRPDDAKVFDYLTGYFTQYLELPSGQTVRDYFDSLQDIEVVERLEDLKASPWYIRTNFSHLLQTKLEDQNKVKAITLLKEAHEIVTRGMEVDGESKKGVAEGMMHFLQESQDLIVPDFHSKTYGDIRQDGQALLDEYAEAEANKGKVWGRFCGIEEIDTNCKGAKKGELWVHAAFPSELKTTLAANWCYNLITHYKTNVVYISLEMPYEQVRRNIIAIHTAHPKWAAQGYAPLDYRKIRDGELTEEERDFYYNKVVPDFTNNPEYCHFQVVTPEREWNMDDIRMQLELFHKSFEVGFVVIDHGQWVEARKGKKSRDYTIELNSVVRDAKRLALHFNHREGLPVLLLFQINRQGKDDAEKAEGEYKMKAITYANEVEKTADVITTTYLDDDHRANGTTKICNLKNRDNPKFAPFNAHVNFICRRMTSIDRLEASDGMSTDEAISIMDVV